MAWCLIKRKGKHLKRKLCEHGDSTFTSTDNFTFCFLQHRQLVLSVHIIAVAAPKTASSIPHYTACTPINAVEGRKKENLKKKVISVA
jgi:hypothetical protein